MKKRHLVIISVILLLLLVAGFYFVTKSITKFTGMTIAPIDQVRDNGTDSQDNNNNSQENTTIIKNKLEREPAKEVGAV